MPISSNATSLERAKISKISKPVTKKIVPTEKNFLTIEPALPNLHNARTLYRRSNSTLDASSSKVNNDVLCTSDYTTLHSDSDGSIHVLRTSEEKEKYPDRISLDRRGLTALPILENENNLRLLSLQHNLINSLENFRHQCFTFLVFLDVYDNQLDKIHCLDRLHNLRVLLMGKNRIKKIDGLENLIKIEVLDLHGNQILNINGLSTLSQLKVLNLAGNQIRTVAVNDLKGLISLQELNLRRNRLKKLLGFGEAVNLRKLFLNNNELQSVEDISSLAKAINIRDISIESNPLSLGGDCVSFLVSYLPHLTSLNNIQITEQVRKAAMAWRRNKESSNAAFMDLTSDVCLNIRREEVISNARTNWELLRSQTKCLTSNPSNAVTVSKKLKPDCDFILTTLTKPELKITRSKPLSISSSVPVLPDKKFISRTFSQDTENSQNTSSSNTSSNEFFRLPPILVPIINKIDQKNDLFSSKVLSGSLSSIGPNIDSSVSSLLSNSETCDSSSDESETSFEVADEETNVPIELKPSSEKSELDEDQNLLIVSNSPIVSKTELKIISPLLGISSDAASNVSSNASVSNVVRRSSTSESETSNLNATKRLRSIKSAVNLKISQSKMKNRPVTCKSRRDGNNDQSSPDNVREQGGDYLIEIYGTNLNVYGHGALRFIDKPWSMSKAKEVVSVNFNYVNFNSLISLFIKLKQRFSNVENFNFKDTNIQCLGQLNALAELQGLSSLTIDDEGNPIKKKKWESYAIFRLSHWGLKLINGKEVTEEDIQNANAEFQSLSDLVLWSLPNVLLQPLLARLQVNIGQKITEQDAKKWLLMADPALKAVVIKEALQWKKGGVTQEDLLLRQKAKTHMSALLEETCNSVHKLRLLDQQWNTILREMVRNILLDYRQIEMYMKKKLQELK